MASITRLLSELGDGRPEAFDQLYALLYPEMRRLAHARLRRSGELTLLDTTALVHETYLRFQRSGELAMSDRGQFMAYAARVMRSVVVDAVRSRAASRHGGDVIRVPLDELGEDPAAGFDADVIRVHESLEALGEVDPRLVTVVEMRYFGGLSEAEIAEALGLTVRTVARDWKKARLFLHASLR